jgi:uncharacterized phage infection (PIP) family protein YhgE
MKMSDVFEYGVCLEVRGGNIYNRYDEFTDKQANAVEDAINAHDTLTETNRLLNLECEELKGDVAKLENGLRDCINALIEASQYSCFDYQKVIEKAEEILGD